MRKLIIPFIFAIFLLGIISAETNPCGNTNSFLGTFRQNSAISLKQTCDSCTYVNISGVTFPDSTTWNLNKAMTKNNINYNYTFSNTSQLGCYYYSIYGNKGGVVRSEDIFFEITPQGWTTNLGFYGISILIVALLFLLGSKLENTWIMMLASIIVLFLGFFIILNGIDVIKDTKTTWAIGLVVLFCGIYFMYLSVEEQLKYWG